ncbi:inositol monophosphatase family protein [Williamsia sp. CHRR-6]|uniref:inositol monophosphatase family protein n=1 Tax=Williamsia sp. CHRR-6 TaxID=2835871 RepID=UPI001BD9C994|nr:inositol monophosphatase family protein [Williamsia sp. CHRR-6]MBT0567939.1 inositol monophosphatase [Williamsia sp. CHRR-6]
MWSHGRVTDTAPIDTSGVDAAALTAIAMSVGVRAASHVRSRREELAADLAARRVVAVSAKSTPTDPVTVVDTEAEALIRGLLQQARPDDAILGEEDGGSVDVPDGVRWVVDPIDGTVNFLYGLPTYAISIAAQIGGVTVAGAVVDVARAVVYAAQRDQGAFVTHCDNVTDTGVVIDPVGCRRLQPSTTVDVSMALVATGFGYSAARREVQGGIVAALLPQVRDLRRVGSAALDLCMVAAGQVDAQFEHGLSPWDWAAGGLIAHEAGARVRLPGPDTRSAGGDVTVAVAPGIADRFFEVLDEVGALDAIPS